MRFWVAALVLLGLICPNVCSMCKILFRAYYNFKAVGFNGSLPYQVDNSTKLFYRLCTNYNDTLSGMCNSSSDFGNLVLVEYPGNPNPVTCTSLASVEKNPTKHIWNLQHHDNLDAYTPGRIGSGFTNEMISRLAGQITTIQEDNNSTTNTGSATSYTIQVDNPQLVKNGITSIAFGLVCNPSLLPANSTYRNQVVNNTLWFFFEGIQACGLDLIEPTVFMRNHFAFPIIIIFLSVVATILRSEERRVGKECRSRW